MRPSPSQTGARDISRGYPRRLALVVLLPPPPPPLARHASVCAVSVGWPVQKHSGFFSSAMSLALNEAAYLGSPPRAPPGRGALVVGGSWHERGPGRGTPPPKAGCQMFKRADGARQTDGRTNERTNEQTNGRTGRQADRQTGDTEIETARLIPERTAWQDCSGLLAGANWQLPVWEVAHGARARYNHIKIPNQTWERKNEHVTC